MVKVIIMKKVGRHKAGKIGEISQRTLEMYGVGNNVIFPRKIPVIIDTIEWDVPNSWIRLAAPEKERRVAPKMQMSMM